MSRPESSDYTPASAWAALVEHWEFDDGHATYTAPGPVGYGLAISDLVGGRPYRISDAGFEE